MDRENRKLKHFLGEVQELVVAGSFDAAADLVTGEKNPAPGHPDTQMTLGIIRQHQGRQEEALKFYENVIDAVPGSPEPHYNKGITFLQLREFKSSIQSFTTFLKITPDVPEALQFRGQAYLETQQYEEAVDDLIRSAKLKSENHSALLKTAQRLSALGRLVEAEKCYRYLLNYNSSSGAVLSGLGIVLQQLGSAEEALKLFDRAVAASPEDAKCHLNKGLMEADQRRPDVAIESFEEALALAPDDTNIASALLEQLYNTCQWVRIEQLEPACIQQTEGLAKKGIAVGLTPFSHITKIDDPARNIIVAKAYAAKIKAEAVPVLPKVQRTGVRREKLSIGYLTSDLSNHPTAHLMGQLFKLHDRSRFQIVIISYGIDYDDRYRRSIQQDSDIFIDVHGITDREAAEKIRQLGIDILVDLKGHTLNSRLGICALRPAPIQVTYLGFPGSTGADFIDYMMTDEIVSPPKEAMHFTEKLVYLPGCYQTTNDHQVISEHCFTRHEVGLPQDALVFCSFNAHYKIDQIMFDLWLRLLKAVPGSVLWLLQGSDIAKLALRNTAKLRGIDPNRLYFAPIANKEVHLGRLKLADIALDTRICGGHTTTSDALWAGIPVITCRGRHFASRVATSVLTAMGLTQCIAESLKEYESLAISLAINQDRLSGLKKLLNSQIRRRPLFNTSQKARDLEAAYNQMWEIWLKGDVPHSFRIAE